MTTLQNPPTPDRRIDDRSEQGIADKKTRDARKNGGQGTQDVGEADPIADIIERSNVEQAKRKRKLGLDPNL
ncbi:hypothetical protein [Hoeflea poritis]|uniref:Uncharacterized protein n=1 Tax=Hoeflea poritis TaxID=2993659 RepID=A0ABT4VIM5_9HYPH|nr:hypothetical protein [Hoeflea poritis]MDA4843982.1 hypothetical protein [Hoeflea poritis]